MSHLAGLLTLGSFHVCLVAVNILCNLVNPTFRSSSLHHGLRAVKSLLTGADDLLFFLLSRLHQTAEQPADQPAHQSTLPCHVCDCVCFEIEAYAQRHLLIFTLLFQK
jgi:hypothetical protein